MSIFIKEKEKEVRLRMNFINFYLGEENSDLGHFLHQIWERVEKLKYTNEDLRLLFPTQEDMTENDWLIFTNDFAIERNLVRSIFAFLLRANVFIIHSNAGQYAEISYDESFDPQTLSEKYINDMIQVGNNMSLYGLDKYKRAIKDFLLLQQEKNHIVLNNNAEDALIEWNI